MIEMQLCDPATGMVEGAWLDQHNRLTKETTPTGKPFACTGGACYVFGEHIRCTSEFHKKPVAAPGTLQHRHEGLALVRVANDVRDHFEGDPNVPQDFLDDLDTIEQLGRRMYFSRPITLAAGVSLSGIVLSSGAGA
jgi:hypothetical protein